MNYFELFNLPVSFDVDIAAITEHYRELQKQYHPDRFATVEENEKLAVVQKAAEINDAYATLKDPVLRAEYILKLRGLDIQHETQTLQDPVFLMQQMELRERLEELPKEQDIILAIENFERTIQSDISAYQENLATLLQQGEDEASANVIRKLKFMFKLLVELERLEDEHLEF